MIEAACHCGAVRFTVEVAPEEVNDCTCSICRRLGALWAYYEAPQVRFAEGNGPTDTYVWNKRVLAFHRCRACGCVTHWASTGPAWAQGRMGVNARLFEPQVLTGARRVVNGEPTD